MRHHPASRFAVLLALSLGLASPAASNIMLGEVGPNFTKSQLGPGTTIGPAVSLYDFADKPVVVLFLLGYN